MTFTATVTGLSPTGTVSFLDGATQIGTATLAGGVANLTTSSLAVGGHSITARYGGDANNAASISGTLVQNVDVPADSTKLRALQVSATPIIAQLWGQAVVGAVEGAIGAGFNDNPQPLTPNGTGFTVQIPLGPPTTPIRHLIGHRLRSRPALGPGSLANGRQGGNGAPPGTRLIDMPVIPLPPGSGMPPPGETRFAPDQVVIQFAAGTTPQQIAGIAQRFGLTILDQQAMGMLGRTVYVFHIANGQSVRQVIGRVRAAGIHAAVQPNYNYGLTQAQNKPDANAGASAQYI
ncbi:MAG TPA: Ig-like domain-containing protein, partial [Mycobacterium sp.]|nr:Ig-like domain-containing protein [Mycobacterium sp.]